MIIFFPGRMGYRQHHMVIDKTDCLPALLVIRDAIQFCKNVRIKKNAGRQGKADPVLALIRQSLGVIPFEA
nr:hypothetical protein [Asticcacaulis excentricus]